MFFFFIVCLYWPIKISLNRHFVLKYLYQARKVSAHVHALWDIDCCLYLPFFDFGTCSDSVIFFVFHFICTFCFAVFCCCLFVFCFVLFGFCSLFVFFLFFFALLYFLFLFCLFGFFLVFAFVLFYFLLLCFVCLFIFCFVFCLLWFLCGYFKANIRQANNDRLKQVEDFIRQTFLLIDFLLHFRCQSLLKHVFI
jgi:hypothetical protein